MDQVKAVFTPVTAEWAAFYRVTAILCKIIPFFVVILLEESKNKSSLHWFYIKSVELNLYLIEMTIVLEYYHIWYRTATESEL